MRAPREGPPDERGGGWSFGAFAALSAAGLLLDQLWWGGFEILSWHGLVVLLACWTLGRPRSVGRCAALLGAEVVAVGADLPAVGTHRLLMLIVAGTVLVQLAAMTLSRRALPAPDEAFTALAPFLRAALVVVYAFAALAKLNTAFVDPVTSCATPLTRGLLGPDVPATLLTGAVVATMVVEAGLALLLAVPRTRPVGLVLGVGFHVVLALAGNVPFAGVALALYAAFLPADLGARLPRHRLRPRRWWGDVLSGALVGGWLVGAWLGPSDDAPGLTAPPSATVSPAIRLGAQLAVVGLVLGGAVLVVLARRAAPGPFAPPPGTPLAMHRLLAVGAVILVVNGLAPYLGLKTDTSFEMFSGLRTEPGAWNSLVMPEAMRVFGYQDDVVTVLSTNDPALPRGTSLLRFELDRVLRTHPGSVATVTGIADGATTETLGPLPPGPTLVERIAVFRPLAPPGFPRC